MNKPVYKLRELIREKYSEEKFGLGLNMVAQWVNATTGADWNAKTVANFCCCDNADGFPLLNKEAESLRQLFGLKETNELFNS